MAQLRRGGWLALLGLAVLGCSLTTAVRAADAAVDVDGASQHDPDSLRTANVSTDAEDPYAFAAERAALKAGLPMMRPLSATRWPPRLPKVYLRDGPVSEPLGWTVVNETRDPDIARVLHRLHAQQHPPVTTCTSRRLLVVQYAHNSFEGVGSVLKLLIVGLAEAVYSNRTLVWGLDVNSHDYSRDAWAVGDGHGHDAPGSAPQPAPHGTPLPCEWWHGGGATHCFFRSLSSCGLRDVTWEELTGLGTRGHDPAARVRILEARKSPAAYMPPPGAFPKGTLDPRHKWAAALAAYVFRLKPDLLAAYTRTQEALGWAEDTACMHVRHGDVLAMPDVYTNRRAFPFSDYFAALHAQSGPVPSAIFVASDSVMTGKALALERARVRWGAAAQPRLITVNESERFVTPHGSHTVAAEGACTAANTCSLQWYDVLHYKRTLKSDRASRVARLMNVLYESVEDMFLLSQCKRIVTVACSHFSTTSVLLSWAATGGASVSHTQFLDQQAIDEGELQNAFLHGSVNATSRSVPGIRRWRAMQQRFIEGLWSRDIIEKLTAPAQLMHTNRLLPYMPPTLFVVEAARWLGTGPVKPVWPGECPAPRLSGEATQAYISRLINLGAEHNDLFHYHQAIVCWETALAEAMAAEDELASSFVDTVTDVVGGNIAAVREKDMLPFSFPLARLPLLIKHTLRLPLNATLQVPPHVAAASVREQARLDAIATETATKETPKELEAAGEVLRKANTPNLERAL